MREVREDRTSGPATHRGAEPAWRHRRLRDPRGRAQRPGPRVRTGPGPPGAGRHTGHGGDGADRAVPRRQLVAQRADRRRDRCASPRRRRRSVCAGRPRARGARRAAGRDHRAGRVRRAAATAFPTTRIAIRTDGDPATIERVRTATQVALPTSVVRTVSEAAADVPRSSSELGRVVSLGVIVAMLLAGASLAIAVISGLVERRTPFALLRLAGMPLDRLRAVLVLEAAAPLVAVAALSAVLGCCGAARDPLDPDPRGATARRGRRRSADRRDPGRDRGRARRDAAWSGGSPAPEANRFE